MSFNKIERKLAGYPLAAVFLLTILLRIPAFNWRVISDDEAVYDSMAKIINTGGIMYRDAVDHKPPGLTYSYALAEKTSYTLFGHDIFGMNAVHLLGLMVSLLTVYGLFLVSKKILRSNLIYLPSLLYTVVTVTKSAYDGLAVNGELMMNAFIIFGVYFVLMGSTHKRKSYDFLAGLFIGVAGLYKWQALIVGLSLPFLNFPNCTLSFSRRMISRGSFWMIGLAVPLALTAFSFSKAGVLSEALQWGGLFNVKYIADGPNLIWSFQRLCIQLLSVVLPSFFFYFSAVQGAFRFGENEESSESGSLVRTGLLTWAILSVFAVGIGGRFFGHYFLQAELPLSILAAAPVATVFKRRPRLVFASLVIPALVFWVFSWSPALTHRLFDSESPDWNLIGDRLAKQSQSTESLFVWGNAPQIYSDSDRLLGTRFSFCNYLTGLSPGTPSEYDPSILPQPSIDSAWTLLFSDFEVRKPPIFLDTAAAGWKGYGKFPITRYPRLEAYLQTHYRREADIQGAILYRRVN